MIEVDLHWLKSKIDVREADECWNWIGTLVKGYGVIHKRGEHVLAHRLMYELCYGEAPGKLFVRHLCGNPSCVNPSHLALGTHVDNMHDMLLHGRRIVGSKCPQAKVSESQVLQMRKMHAEGVSQKYLCKVFGLSSGHVSQIINRKEWSHI
jgi:hypothetical protein